MSSRVPPSIKVAVFAAIVGGATGAVVTTWLKSGDEAPTATTTHPLPVGAGTLTQGELLTAPPAPRGDGGPEWPRPVPELPPRAELAAPSEPPDAAVKVEELATTGDSDAGAAARPEAEPTEPQAVEPEAEPPREPVEKASTPSAQDDAGAYVVNRLNELARGPTFSAGAGRFMTEPPPWAASAWVSNPNAGAGQFMTAAPPWAASAITDNPQAGAGAFTTDRSTPAGPSVMAPYFMFYAFPGPTDPAPSAP